MTFAKVAVGQSGEGEGGGVCALELKAGAFARYNESSREWAIPVGAFRVDVASSSAHTEASFEINIQP